MHHKKVKTPINWKGLVKNFFFKSAHRGGKEQHTIIDHPTQMFMWQSDLHNESEYGQDCETCLQRLPIQKIHITVTYDSVHANVPGFQHMELK